MDASQLASLLAQHTDGRLTVTEVISQLIQGLGIASTADVQIDLDRYQRCGAPEVVYAPGKTPTAIIQVFQTLRNAGQACFATRVSPEQAAAVREELPWVEHSSPSRTLRWESLPKVAARVAIITAGTSDRPVAEEAAETVRWLGCDVDILFDLGVAGPHRLISQLSRLRQVQSIVVVAGMEAALPSVVGGHVACPVIAVPTSVGYGTSFHGLTALLGMLNSCASNVTVVNIDAGFKGGYVAGLIARQANLRLSSPA